MRRIAVLVGVAANVAVVAAVMGTRAATALALAWLALFAFALILLPRAAHSAFTAGRYAAAGRRYRAIARLSLTPLRRAAALISLSACYIGAGDYRRGTEVLAGIALAGLDATTRAAWLNNRAYAALRDGDDPVAALAWAEEAMALRPDVAALMHTVGVALLASGRVDEAIRTFDALWSSGDLPPRLEAERCWDLARAWELKGQLDYATDYRARAVRTCAQAVPRGAAVRIAVEEEESGPVAV